MILLRTGTVLSLRDRDEMDANTSRSYHLGAANIFALHVMAIASKRASDRIERAVCAQFCLRSSVHPATSEKLSLNHLDSDTRRCL